MALVQTTNLPFNEEEAVSALTGLNSHYPAPQPPEISVNQANSHQNGVFENSTSSSLQNIDNSDLTITTPEMIEPTKIIFPSLGSLSGGEDESEKSNSYSARPINFKVLFLVLQSEKIFTPPSRKMGAESKPGRSSFFGKKLPFLVQKIIIQAGPKKYRP